MVVRWVSLFCVLFCQSHTCIPVADSFWYLAKLIQFVKFKNKIKLKKKQKKKQKTKQKKINQLNKIVIV